MSLNLDSIRIHIVSWEKYNPRKNVKCSSWFRMEHNLFTNPHFYSFTTEEMVCWFYLLCERSKASPQNDKTGLRVHANHFTVCTRLSEKVLHRTIKKLQEEQLITVRTLRGRYVDATRTCSTYDTKRNNTPLPPEGNVGDWDLGEPGNAARGEPRDQDTLQESSVNDLDAGLNLNTVQPDNKVNESTSQEPPPPKPRKPRSKVKESDFEKVENLATLWNALKAPEMLPYGLPLDRANKDQQQVVKRVIKVLEKYPDLSDWKAYINFIASRDWARGKTSIDFLADFEYLTKLSTIEKHFRRARQQTFLNEYEEVTIYE